MSGDSTCSKSSRLIAAISLAAIVVAFTIMVVQRPPYVLAAGFAPQLTLGEPSNEPLFETTVASGGSTEYAHSATAAHIGGGRIRACWMAGSRESHADVAIHTAVFDPQTQTWSPESAMITLEWLRRHLRRNVISLGNPVIMQHEDGRLLLWFVSVSLGGWSGSALNMTVSHDGGETWEPPMRLVTSPFFNVSTLVRQPGFVFSDGTLGLPVYHECMGIFGELLRLDPNGRVLHKQRLSWGRSMLQPKIVARNDMEATGYFRRYTGAPPHVHGVQTSDGGRTWSAPLALDLPNPGTPIAAVRLENGELVLVFNDTHDGYTHLTLAVSPDDGETWKPIQVIDGHGGHGSAKDVRYPALVRDSNHEFHLLYTADHKHIRHVRFNAAWLEQNR